MNIFQILKRTIKVIYGLVKFVLFGITAMLLPVGWLILFPMMEQYIDGTIIKYQDWLISILFIVGFAWSWIFCWKIIKNHLIKIIIEDKIVGGIILGVAWVIGLPIATAHQFNINLQVAGIITTTITFAVVGSSCLFSKKKVEKG